MAARRTLLWLKEDVVRTMGVAGSIGGFGVWCSDYFGYTRVLHHGFDTSAKIAEKLQGRYRMDNSKKHTYIRPEIERAAKEIQDYIDGFRGEGYRFLLVTGPNASGKSTLIQMALDGRHGVNYIKLDLKPGDVPDLRSMIAAHFGIELAYIPSAEWFLRRLNETCLRKHKENAALYINLKAGGKSDLTYMDCAAVARAAASAARDLTYDTPALPVIIETSVPVLGQLIPDSQPGICRELHVAPMTLTELEEAYNEAHGSNKRFKELLGGQDYKKGLEEWYFAMGGNLRKLEAELEKCSSPEDFKSGVFYKFKTSVKGVSNLDAQQKAYLKRVIQAGPEGFRPTDDKDIDVELDLLHRDPKDAVLRKVRRGVTMQYMAHMLYLLDGNREELKKLKYV